MGLSIFYSGALRDSAQIPDLVEEVSDICDSIHWPCEIFEPSKEFPLSGVMFHPPGADEIWLTFLTDGCLASPFSLYDITGEEGDLELPITINSVVQFAGPEKHIQLIEMLRHLSKKYFSAFELTDESEYWESGDPQKCRDWFKMFDGWMQNMSEDLGTLDGRGNEDGSKIRERFEDLLRNGTPLMDCIKVMRDPFRKN